MKKLWISLGLIASTCIPVLSVIACNKNSKLDKANAKIQTVTTTTVIAPTKKNKVRYGIAPVPQDLTPPTQKGFSFNFKVASAINDKGESKVTYVANINPAISGTTPKELTFIVGGFETKVQANARKNLQLLLENITDDGLYLVKGFYKGTIYNASKQFTHGEEKSEVSKMAYQRIPKTSGWGRDQHVIQMAKGDSLIMAYDKDDSDGLKQENFEDTILFDDTSIARQKTIFDINKKISKIKESNSSSYLIMFKQNVDQSSGYLAPYIGSQSNHINITYEQAIKILEQELSIEIVNEIKEYYKTASKAFKALYMKKTFIYERINPRAIKITFIGDLPITAAKFWIWPIGSTSKFKYGTYSLSKIDFPFYEQHENNYFFLGRHET